MPDEKDNIAENLRKKLITRDHFKDPAQDEQLIREFGKYELVSKIGEGASGEIYLAYDKSLSRHVAIKILQRMNKQDIQRFQREAEYLAKLTHPNIIQVYEIAEFQGQLYIAMQYIHGQSPDNLSLNINQAMSVIKQVAQALQYAHKLSIIHRDIKPSNIIIDKDFKAYLMDFGIAKQAVDKTSTISLTGSIIGTPAFMSPEQARGEIHNIDPRTDIYGLGSTLYYLVTHVEPFSGASTVEIINKVQSEEPQGPRKVNKEIPMDVEAIILKAMAKEKSRRYQTVSDFIHDIELYLAGEPVMAKRTSVATRVIKKISREKSAVFVVLFILTLLSVTFYYLNEERKAKRLQQESLSLVNKGLAIMNQALKMSYNSESDPAEIRMQLEEAVQFFQQAIDKYPLALAYYYKGKIYREVARYKEATTELSKALSIDPAMDIARIERAYVQVLECVDKLYILEGQSTHEVASYLNNALNDIASIKEEGLVSVEAKQARIFVLAVKDVIDKRFDEAVNLLKQSKGLKDNEDFLHWLGVVYSFKKDFETSIEYQTKATEIRPHYAVAYLSRANAYLGKRKPMDAINDLDKAIYINPWLIGAYVTRGFIYSAYGYPDRALADFNKVIELMPDSEVGYVNRGDIFYKKGDFDAALKDYNKALEINPQSVKAYICRGNLFGELKEYSKALEDHNKAISLDSNYSFAYASRGVTYVHLNELDRALADFQRSIELNPRDPRAYIKIAAILADQNEIDAALEYLNKVIEIEKNYADGYKARGMIYFSNEMFDQAKEDLEKAIELDPRLRPEIEPVLDQIKKRER